MSTLFFLPWVSCTRSVPIGQFALLPYQRKKLPGTTFGMTQESLDAVLGRYGDRKYGLNRDTVKSVERATIIWWDGDTADTKLSEESISERLVEGQLLVFSALAERRFTQSRYYNSDTLTLVAQPFDAARPAILSVMSRLRYGHSLNMIGTTAGAPVFMRPPHVDANPRIEIDVPLCTALLQTSSEIGQRLRDAILLFNHANTDSRSVLPAAEIVMLRAAFETLLGTDHHTKSLRKAFSDQFEDCPTASTWPSGPLSENVWRTRWPENVSRPLDAWVQDFCDARNASAHGTAHQASRPPPVWSVHNHLMFGSWLFVLMVKSILSRLGHYKLSDLDDDFRAKFEMFLAYDITSNVSFKKSHWDKVEENIRMDDIARCLYPTMTL